MTQFATKKDKKRRLQIILTKKAIANRLTPSPLILLYIGCAQDSGKPGGPAICPECSGWLNFKKAIAIYFKLKAIANRLTPQPLSHFCI